MTLLDIASSARHREWQGTAAQLAAKLNELLPVAGLEHDAGAANERLIRYYVTEGVLSEPAPQGRERLFGFVQIIEFIAARQLLKDGWPLAKVRELIRSVPDTEALLQLGPVPREPTAAERALARIRHGFKPARTNPAGAPMVRMSAPLLAGPPPAHADPAYFALGRAADLTQRRAQMQADLKSLGNASGSPALQRMLRLELTPWCQVLIDATHLNNMEPTTPRALGDALASALEEERLNSGASK
jgi:DNA-binding transcriptional MerR regulator